MRAKFLIIFLGIGPALFGADFTIVTGETVITTQTLNTAGNVGIVEDGGTINVSAGDGVDMIGGSNQTLSSAGAIATTGDSFNAVTSTGASASITSSGIILTNGNGALGIIATGTSAQIANSGTISTLSTGGVGILASETSAQIFNSGTISTLGTGAGGIESQGTSSQVTNSGTISTAGDTARGIESTASSAVITNSGTISTAGDDAAGIDATGTSARILNSGTISMLGSSFGIGCTGASADVENKGIISTTAASGIACSGNFSRVINNGAISTAGTLTKGIVNGGGSAALLINNGTIVATGGGVSGIFSAGDSSRMINTGTILVNGGAASYGIVSEGISDVITNSGLISVTGLFDTGIISFEDSVFIINSGTIKSAQDNALVFNGTNPTLSLLLGSNLQGTVTSTNALNLNVEKGLNLRLTIVETNGFGALNIGSPFVTVGNTETVAVIDPTGFTMQADVLEDLSDSVLDSIYRGKYDYLHCQGLHCGAWAEAIGTSRVRNQSINYKNWEGGGLAGANWEACCCGTLGIFGGGTFGQATVGQDTQRATVSTALVGLSYEQMYNNLFVGFAMTTGYVNWHNRRTVMYNLAPGGEQDAIADINGWMVSPELTASGWLCLSRKWSLLTTGTLRYAGLFLGSYDESGSDSDLSVSSRQVDLLKVIGELAFSAVGRSGCRSWNFEPYLGLAGRFQVGGRDVSTELLGQSLDFDQGSPYDLIEVLFGIRGQETIGRYTLYGNIEGLVDNFDSERVLGELGVRYLF